MWYKWLIFAIFFILIPIGFVNLKLLNYKKVNFTKEQEKSINLKLGLGILFYWLVDLFYMAFILDSLFLKFVFGGLIMLIVFFNLSKAFINGSSQPNWWLLQDFIVGVGMSIYLIYIIPNEDLKNVVIPIVSAVYGGIITLVGVAWTIRKADNDRKSDERKSICPIIYPYNRNNIVDYKQLGDMMFEDEDTDNYHYLGVIKNTDNGIFIIRELIVDDNIFKVKYGDVLDKNKFSQIILKTDKGLSYNNVILSGTDIKGNVIQYRLTLDLKESEILKIEEK